METNTMKQIQNAFRESDAMMDDLARAVRNSKINSTYLSNETIASVIVNSLDQSDALEVAERMEEIMKGKYGTSKN